MSQDPDIDELFQSLRLLTPVRETERPEPLLPELERYFHDRFLSHPLIVRSGVNRSRAAGINQAFQEKKARSQQAFRDRDWRGYIFLHERPYRFGALRRCISRNLFQDDETFNEAIREVWIDSENARQIRLGWRSVWARARLLESERSVLAAMPELLTIFRGVRNRKAWRGVSWTLDVETARWFATRFSDTRVLVSGAVNREFIKAYLTERDESEVIVLPEQVQNVQTETARRL